MTADGGSGAAAPGKGVLIRVASVVQDSIVDGPGLRYTLFTQGCPHCCAGCHNPETHDPCGGYDLSIGEILRGIDRNPLLRGVTFSGGEPMRQAPALIPLAKEVGARGLSLWIYTGYLWEEILQNGAYRALAELADTVVDGLFVQERKTPRQPFRGSANQRLIDVRKSLMTGKVCETRF